MRWTALVFLSCAVLVLIGCGGHAPTLPSPDDVAPPVPPDDIIEVDDFIVPFGDTVVYDRHTEVRASGRVQIDGEVIGADGSGPGTDGTSVTLVAEGDIVVTGVVKAGDGMDGTDRTGTGAGDAGGDGGSVTLRSTAGSITIGVGLDVDATSAKRVATGVAAGDGGVGGDGLIGGAGGLGGNVMIECLAGLLTLHPADGLIHIGNGGDGGTGHVPEGYEGDFEQDPGGGDGGHAGNLSTRSQEFVGLEERDGALVIEPADLIGGGGGGHGGSALVGAHVDTTSYQITVMKEDDEWLVRGGGGGDSFNGGAAGGPGKGGDAIHNGFSAVPGLQFGGDPHAQGGPGGNLRFNMHQNSEGEMVPLIRQLQAFAGAPGGKAEVRGRKAGRPIWGGQDGNCERAFNAKSVRATGGPGGRVVEDGVPEIWLRAMDITGGRGGDAYAKGGDGGNAGVCCNPPDIAGSGGDGSRSVRAIGGEGGHQVLGKGGASGNARAEGGNGGDGGQGRPAGGPGMPSADVTATPGTPGRGTPPGERGKSETAPGRVGGVGEECPSPEPPPPTGGYGVTVSDSPLRKIWGMPGFYKPAPAPNQAPQLFSLGGSNFPVVAWVGQSMIFSADNSRLWVGNELGGMLLYRDPLTNNGDRAPDLELHITGMQWYSLWWQESRDILYATTMSTGMIYAWDGASQGNANRQPDRTIEVAGYNGQSYLTGAPDSDRLFMAARVNGEDSIVVYDRADQADGQQAPDRVFRPANFNAIFTHALSWDRGRDLLYIGVPNRGTVEVYEGASALQGAVTPTRIITIDFANMPAGDWISGVVVAPEDDVLFVSMFSGRVLVYRNASTLQGTPAADLPGTMGNIALGMGVFRQ